MLSPSIKESLGTNRRFGKRQTPVYLGGSGQVTNSCQNAVIYSLVNGQLFANTSSGVTQFSTNAGTTYANFTPSANPGAITTTFSVDSQNNLMWTNPSFYNSFARFCILSDNTIVAVFVDPALAPPDCMFVILSMTRVSNCAMAVGMSGPTGMVILSPSFRLSLTPHQVLKAIQVCVRVPFFVWLFTDYPSCPSGPQGDFGMSGIPHVMEHFANFDVCPSGPSGPVGPTGATGPSGLCPFTYRYLPLLISIYALPELKVCHKVSPLLRDTIC